MQLDEIDASADAVAWGILRSEVGTYPVVLGIPVFVEVDESVVGLLAAHELERAAAVAAFGPRSSSRLGLMVEAITAQSRRAERVLDPARRRFRRRAVDHREEVVADGPGRGRRVLAEHYLEGADPSEDAFNYFTLRFGIPRHLVGLAFVAALPPTASVLDLGCGAGQLTWALSQREGGVTGVDRDLGLLFAAAETAPAAELVCADCTSLPFVSDAFDVAFSSDVLSYVGAKPAAVAESWRVLRPGGMLMATSLRNRNCVHVFGGEALSPAGWRQLAGTRPHRLVPDGAVLDAYLGSRTPDLLGTGSDPAIEASQTLCLVVATPEHLEEMNDRPFAAWPHAEGPLALNPLFRPVAQVDGTVVYDRVLPSATYERDNPDIERYLPRRLELPRSVIERARRGERPVELAAAIESVSVLALPPTWPGDRWPLA